MHGAQMRLAHVSLLAMGVKVMRINGELYPLELKKLTITCTSIFNDASKAGDHQVFIVDQDIALRTDTRFDQDYKLYMDEVPVVYE